METSYYRFLKIKKPAFFIVYKNDTDRVYQFEQIKINLNMMYKIQKEYLLFLIKSSDSDNSYENYINYIDTLKTYETLTEDQVISDNIRTITIYFKYF